LAKTLTQRHPPLLQALLKNTKPAKKGIFRKLAAMASHRSVVVDVVVAPSFDFNINLSVKNVNEPTRIFPASL
jgi:hypothetical protein